MVDLATGNLIKHRRSAFSASEKIILVMMFLISLNFLNEFPTIVLITSVGVLVTRHFKIQVENDIFLFLMFAMSLIIFRPRFYNSVVEMLKAMMYPLGYVIGYNLFQSMNSVKKQEKALKAIVWALGVGAFGRYLLNFLTNLGDDARNTIDIWTGRTMSATGQASLASIILALAISHLFSSDKLQKKIVSFIILSVVIGYNLVLAGRTIFVIAAVIMVVLINYKVYKRNSVRDMFYTTASLMVVVLLVIICYKNDVFNMTTWLEGSNFYDRFFSEVSTMEFNEDSRLDMKLSYLEYLLDYPFGGANIRYIVGNYAHDIYLDTYDEAGVMAVVPIIVIVIRFFLKSKKILNNSRVSYDIKLLILSIFLSFNIEFMLEPILIGMPWLLICFSIIYGGLSRMVNEIVGKGNKKTRLNYIE